MMSARRMGGLLAGSGTRSDRLHLRPDSSAIRSPGAQMVVLNRIYTRTGDDGTTSLGSGERRKKYDLRVAAYGTLDEVNAVIGLVRLHTADDPALDGALSRIQNDLFDVE